MSGSLLLFATVIGSPIVLTRARHVTLPSNRVRISDIAARTDLPGATWRRVAGLEVLRLPGRRAVEVSREALGALITRRAPGLRVIVTDGEQRIRLAARPREAPAPLACRTLGTAKAAGEPIHAEDLGRTACTDAIAVRLRRNDATKEYAAPRDLVQGAYVLLRRADTRPGAELRLVSRIGPVTIERPVTALQIGHGGKPLFVRDADGHVFTAKLASR